MAFVRQIVRGHGTPGAAFPTINTADADPSAIATGPLSIAYAAAAMDRIGTDDSTHGNVWSPVLVASGGSIVAKQLLVAAFYEGGGSPGALTIQAYAYFSDLQRWVKVGTAVSCAFATITPIPIPMPGVDVLHDNPGIILAFQPVVAATVADGVYRFQFAADFTAG